MLQNHLFELCCVGAALFITSNLWFYLRVLRPIRLLALRAEQLQAGQLDSFEQPGGGIAEVQQLRRAMAGMCRHVRRAQEQNRAYTERLTDGLENERKRIARELHDETVQSVIAASQAMSLAQEWVRSEPERAVQMLQTARAQAIAVVDGLRDLIGGLRPPALEELGLVAALQMQVQKQAQPEVTLHVEGVPRRLDEARELALFRAAQEALANISRHSRATRADLRLTYSDNSVLLMIEDDGIGFEPPAQLGDFALNQRYGLLGMHERVAGLDGWLRVNSRPGHGTKVEVGLSSDGSHQPDHLVRDPVCSALIEPQQAYGSVEYEGETYYFCCPVCQGAFRRSPETYRGVPLTDSST